MTSKLDPTLLLQVILIVVSRNQFHPLLLPILRQQLLLTFQEKFVVNDLAHNGLAGRDIRLNHEVINYIVDRLLRQVVELVPIRSTRFQEHLLAGLQGLKVLNSFSLLFRFEL